MAESGQEKTEDATPRRRLDARKKGTVAKSNDLTGSLVLMALLMALPSAVSSLGNGFMASLKVGLTDIPTQVSQATLGAHLWSVMQPSMGGLALVIGVVMAVGIAANFAQVGFLLSTESLTPNFNKLNPMNGIKRLFSVSATFEGAKAAAKCLVFGWVAYAVIRSNWGELLNIAYVPAPLAASKVGAIIQSIMMKVGMVWLALAAFDYFFQRKQIDKQLRMTKQEVKQEMKEAETSPELRAAMARKRRQMSRGSMMEAVKTADVVVTNPTHFSVALKYDPEKNHAPQVVAKGQDFIAAKIRELAKEYKVPIVPNPPLARALHKQCEIGDFVPGELFQPVAEVLAYVWRTVKKVKKL